MRTVAKVLGTSDHAAASILVPVTASLTAAKTFGLSQYAPTPVLWGSIGIAEAGKAFTALLLAIGQYENLGTFAKDFFSKVIAPAAWTVACAFAVMGKILFEKPADAVVFAPAFAYNSAIKLCSAVNHYRKNEAYGNDLVIAIAMAMLSLGVSGILLNANPMVALTVVGAMLNLFKDVICPAGLLANLRISPPPLSKISDLVASTLLSTTVNTDLTAAHQVNANFFPINRDGTTVVSSANKNEKEHLLSQSSQKAIASH